MTNDRPGSAKLKPVKQGKLLVSIKGIITWSWQPLWCILYPPIDSDPAKILMYVLSDVSPPSLTHLKQEVQLSHHCTLDKNTKGRGYPFRIIVSKKKKVKLSALSPEVREDWMKTLSETIPCIEDEMASASSEVMDEGAAMEMYMDNDVYESAAEMAQWEVTIKENDDTERIGLKGAYWLSINDFNISLIDKKSDKVICYWSYKSIRGFGKGRSCFSLEAGSSSSTGRGLFAFVSNDGETMFTTARGKLQKMKDANKDTGSNKGTMNRKVSLEPTASMAEAIPGRSSKQNSLDRYVDVDFDNMPAAITKPIEQSSRAKSEEMLYAQPMKSKPPMTRMLTEPYPSPDPYPSPNPYPSPTGYPSIHASSHSSTYEEIQNSPPYVTSNDPNKVDSIDPYTYSLVGSVDTAPMSSPQEDYACIDENLYDDPDPLEKADRVKVTETVAAEGYDHLDFPAKKNSSNRPTTSESDDYAHIENGDVGGLYEEALVGEGTQEAVLRDCTQETVVRDSTQL